MRDEEEGGGRREEGGRMSELGTYSQGIGGAVGRVVRSEECQNTKIAPK